MVTCSIFNTSLQRVKWCSEYQQFLDLGWFFNFVFHSSNDTLFYTSKVGCSICCYIYCNFCHCKLWFEKQVSTSSKIICPVVLPFNEIIDNNPSVISKLSLIAWMKINSCSESIISALSSKATEKSVDESIFVANCSEIFSQICSILRVILGREMLTLPNFSFNSGRKKSHTPSIHFFPKHWQYYMQLQSSPPLQRIHFHLFISSLLAHQLFF